MPLAGRATLRLGRPWRRPSTRRCSTLWQALYVGTGIEESDYLATVDVDSESSTYSHSDSDKRNWPKPLGGEREEMRDVREGDKHTVLAEREG